MDVELVGANPGLSLFDGADELVAFVSVWNVDWSVRGAGRAIVLWHRERTRLLATDAELGRWLAESFVRHFPELDGQTWTEPEPEPAEVRWDLDPATGVVAGAADVEIALRGPLDRRVAATDAFELGGVTRGFSTVYVPCRSGSLRVGGQVVPGSVRISGDPPSSSAFLAVAEVWTSGSRTNGP